MFNLRDCFSVSEWKGARTEPALNFLATPIFKKFNRRGVPLKFEF